MSLPPQVAAALTLRHREALLALRDPERQIALAEQAAGEGWTSRRLERVVSEQRSTRGGGRRPRPGLVHVLAGIHRLLGEEVDAAGIAERDRAEVRRLWEAVGRGLSRIAEVFGPALLVAACTEGGAGGKDRNPVDTAGLVDADADGYVARDDCDDDAPDVHPGVPDPCNGVDDDCSGVVDDGVAGEASLCAEDEALWFVQEQEYTHMDGCAASISGDFDGDGRSDLLFGGGGWYVPAEDQTGRVHVLLAADLDPGVVPTVLDRWQLRGAPGDYAGECAYGSGNGGTFVPDLDGDGRDDILVGAAQASGGLGVAYVVTAAALDGAVGELKLPDFADSLYQDASGDAQSVGIAVANAGDADGDGVADLVVGASRGMWVVPYQDAGGGRVDLGSGTFLEAGTTADSIFGRAVSCAGDVDGDGLGDLVVPCEECGFNGTTYLYLGASLGRWGTVIASDDADLVIEGSSRTQDFGTSSAGGADMDGDGLDDWVATSNIDDADLGGVFVFLASQTRIGQRADATTADAHIGAVQDGSGLFGNSVSMGDFDGDGSPDLAVVDNYPGIWYYLFAGDELAAGGEFRVNSARTTFTARDDALFSYATLRMDGDVNGDGVVDLLAADPTWSPGGGWDAFGAAVLLPGG